jgi:hypothetical protein
MIDERERFERAFDLFDLPEPSWDRLLQRRDRKQRNARIGAAVVAIAIAVIAFGVVAKAFLGGTVPANLLPDSPRSWTWTALPAQTDSGNNGVYAVTDAGPGLVAVGSSQGHRHIDGAFVDGPATVWTSADGESWTRLLGCGDKRLCSDLGGDTIAVGSDLGLGVIEDAAIGGPGVVAVGSFGGTPDRAHVGPDFRDGVVWTSVDGRSWTRLQDPEVFGSNVAMLAVASGPAGIVAVGSKDPQGAYPEAPIAPESCQMFPGAWFSTDGRVWEPTPVGGNGTMLDVTAVDDGFLAVGCDLYGGAIWTSGDGRAWRRIQDPETSGMVLTSVVDGPNGLVAVGSISADPEGSADDPVALTSEDGVHWTQAGRSAFAHAAPTDDTAWIVRASSVAAADGGYVAVGQAKLCPPTSIGCGPAEAVVWTSADGRTWTRVASAPVFRGTRGLGWAGMRSVTAWRSGFVAVGPGRDGQQAAWLGR